jgi:hypothetical protein
LKAIFYKEFSLNWVSPQAMKTGGLRGDSMPLGYTPVRSAQLCWALPPLSILFSKEDELMMRVLNFVAGLIIGVIIGAMLILLITPQSGQDLQQRFKDWLDSVMNEGRKAFEARRVELERRMADIQAGRES